MEINEQQKENADNSLVSSQQYLKKLTEDNSKNWLTNMFEGVVKQALRCHSCGQISTKFEPFTSLSLPVSFDPNRNNARLSVVYIYDTDKFTRYDLYFKPGKYSLQEVSDRLKNIA